MAEEKKKKVKGQLPDADGKCRCERCGKRMGQIQFYTYRDGSKCELCKMCISAHIDNFNPETFEWILEKMDVPYLPPEWNTLRDKAFAKDPYKMNGLSVIGKYLGKMRLNQWAGKGYADSQKILEQEYGIKQQKEQEAEQEKIQYEKELRESLEKGEINRSQYETLMSTETQNQELPKVRGDVITGLPPTAEPPKTYQEALNQMQAPSNPFIEGKFLPQDELESLVSNLSKEEQIRMALKWGRLYRPAQWVALEKLYKEFMQSFDVQGAARLDTLKKICKTSLKMDQAIDSGDIETYQKLSRVYDSLMKAGKFTEAQNKEEETETINSASAIVEYLEKNHGKIPKYVCDEPQDLVDKIILDLKRYTKNLIYEDKSLGQEIEKYLQSRKNSEEVKKTKEEAEKLGLDYVPLTDDDLADFKEQQELMKEHDQELTDERITYEIKERRLKIGTNDG